MKRPIKIVSILLLMIFMLVGCASKETIKTYTPESGMYNIMLPGEWKEENNIEAKHMLNLSRKDGVEGIILGIPKMSVIGEIENLEELYAYIDKMLLNGEAANSESKDVEAIQMTDMKAALAKEITMTQANGAEGKVFMECIETDQAFYMMMFSSTEGFEEKMPKIKEQLTLEEIEVRLAELPEDTIRWFDATYALLNTINKKNINQILGLGSKEMSATISRALLKQNWGITSKDEADETIQWLISEGDNQGAVEYVIETGAVEYPREELIEVMDLNDFTNEEKIDMLAAYDAYMLYGDNAILAWDQSRAMTVIDDSYLAGFYTYEEAMDKCLEIAKMIQGTFDTWDDFMNSYLYGYSYWSSEDINDLNSMANQRKEIYEMLKNIPNGPYSVDWNTKLEKAW